MVCQDSDGNVVLIDYKSNHLGNDASAYTQQAMNEAVAHHHYYLQALIYAVAIARYYALRGKPLLKIAIRYLFLRGMDGTEQGIWNGTSIPPCFPLLLNGKQIPDKSFC